MVGNDQFVAEMKIKYHFFGQIQFVKSVQKCAGKNRLKTCTVFFDKGGFPKELCLIFYFEIKLTTDCSGIQIVSFKNKISMTRYFFLKFQ